MVQIGKLLVSDEVFEKRFLCDLAACKGACCVEGESGAPLDVEEVAMIEHNYDVIKEYMRPEGIAAIEEQGLAVVDTDGDLVTPLINGNECAYVHFDERGTAKCAMETAFRAGKTDFLKPISCHLYPIRLNPLHDMVALNYHYWPVCDPARVCGAKVDLKVFRFLREPLIRKFGVDFFAHLEEVDALLEAERKK